MNKVLLLIAICMLASCATSRYAGNSLEAREARDEKSYDVLDRFSPDNCIYNQYKEEYQCDKPNDALKMNTRIKVTRQKIVEYLRDDPYTSDIEKFGFIILEELYYCRNRNGSPLGSNESTMYCESKFSTTLNDHLSQNYKLHYIGVVKGLHKYMTQ